MEPDQIPPNQHCIACNADFEVERIIKEQGSTTYYLSCGHPAKTKVINEGIEIRSRELLKRKNRDKSHKFYKNVFRIKLSKNKRPARENILIDKERQVIVHHVEEQNECGEWKVVHSHEDPFPVKADDQAW
jgi:hypothetical protein